MYKNVYIFSFRFSRMNDLVIIQTSQGLAKYVLQAAAETPEAVSA